MRHRHNLISFKVSEEVLNQLEDVQRTGESLSLTAKRLLEEAVGQAEPPSTVESKLADILLLLESPMSLFSASLLNISIIRAELGAMDRFEEDDISVISCLYVIALRHFFESEEFQELKNDVFMRVIESVWWGDNLSWGESSEPALVVGEEWGRAVGDRIAD